MGQSTTICSFYWQIIKAVQVGERAYKIVTVWQSMCFEGFSFAVLSLDWLDLSSNHFNCRGVKSLVNKYLEENNENKYRLLGVH